MNATELMIELARRRRAFADAWHAFEVFACEHGGHAGSQQFERGARYDALLEASTWAHKVLATKMLTEHESGARKKGDQQDQHQHHA